MPKPSKEMPIDIQCNKLVDWLISRRHCNIKWQQSAVEVKAKIADALKDMPGTKEMKELVEVGSCFHYYKCKKIVNVLRDTEKDSKNIFGMYSSQRMKDWQEILKLYEHKNLHLAELSSRLLRNINYEIPETKKQIAKCGQVQQECQKKVRDCERNSAEVRRKYAEDCKKIGIAGVNLKRELLKLAENIPQEFEDIATECKELYPIVEYYAAFVAFTVGSDDYSDEITPLTKHISQHGNTTVYQLRHGVAPDKIVKADDAAAGKPGERDENVAEDEIDWGFDDDIAEAVATDDDVIDFDISIEECGIVIEDESDATAATTDNNGGFEIVSVDDLSKAAQHSKEQYNVAEGDEAMTLLEDFTTRTNFINELIEIRAFLNQRLAESKVETDLLSISQFQSAPSILQLTSSDEVEQMHAQVTAIFDRLMSTRTVYLCRILDSPKFVERLADTLKRQLSLTSKYESQRLAAELRADESLVEQQSLYPKLDSYVAETKRWRKLIQKDISSRYNNRRVNLMGAINFI